MKAIVARLGRFGSRGAFFFRRFFPSAAAPPLPFFAYPAPFPAEAFAMALPPAPAPAPPNWSKPARKPPPSGAPGGGRRKKRDRM